LRELADGRAVGLQFPAAAGFRGGWGFAFCRRAPSLRIRPAAELTARPGQESLGPRERRFRFVEQVFRFAGWQAGQTAAAEAVTCFP
jgi:hypothetical protein